VSLMGTGSIDYLFGGASKEKYPSGYSGKYMFMDLSFGVNVYFKPLGAKSTPKPVIPAEPPPTSTPPSTPSAAPADTSKSK